MTRMYHDSVDMIAIRSYDATQCLLLYGMDMEEECQNMKNSAGARKESTVTDIMNQCKWLANE